MMLLKKESVPIPDMDMKEDWYLNLLTDKSLSGGNSVLLGEPGPGKAYGREEKAIGYDYKNNNPCKLTNLI